MKKIWQYAFGFIAIGLVLWLQALPVRAAAPTGLEGKTLSVLGDSISTYLGVSNDSGTNTTIGDNDTFYRWGTMGVTLQDTWWYQTANSLGMRLLVNNSWSGSCMLMEGAGTKGAWQERCIQLHSNAGINPDIIAVFMGTNDQDYFPERIGSFRDIRFENLIAATPDGFSYAQPATCMEAYAIALHKMQQRYPNAEIYCFTLPQRPYHNPESLLAFNAELTCLAEHFGVFTVDLFHCGISSEETSFFTLMGDYVHPGPKGMTAISGAFVDAILENSRYLLPETPLCKAIYDLKKVFVGQGLAQTLIQGKPFRAELTPIPSHWDLRVGVTMGGQDITDSCYDQGVIHISSVTGNIEITASAVKPPPTPRARSTAGTWICLTR